MVVIEAASLINGDEIRRPTRQESTKVDDFAMTHDYFDSHKRANHLISQSLSISLVDNHRPAIIGLIKFTRWQKS
uniref:Uncharacterized protein n=1 Tax=Tetranychus urticae TaxID=32264 RepID=T1K3K5_TETUR